MRIAIGSDHAGYRLKNRLREWLDEHDCEVQDLGPAARDAADDYPDFAGAVARSVQVGESDLGIMICSTGVGSCIAANKLSGVRAALCHDPFSARRSREHNDANVLCIGADIVGQGLAEDIVAAWFRASFTGEARHRRRLEKIARLETPGED